jgi:hypothetical protein
VQDPADKADMKALAAVLSFGFIALDGEVSRTLEGVVPRSPLTASAVFEDVLIPMWVHTPSPPPLTHTPHTHLFPPFVHSCARCTCVAG